MPRNGRKYDENLTRPSATSGTPTMATTGKVQRSRHRLRMADTPLDLTQFPTVARAPLLSAGRAIIGSRPCRSRVRSPPLVGEISSEFAEDHEIEIWHWIFFARNRHRGMVICTCLVPTLSLSLPCPPFLELELGSIL